MFCDILKVLKARKWFSKAIITNENPKLKSAVLLAPPFIVSVNTHMPRLLVERMT